MNSQTLLDTLTTVHDRDLCLQALDEVSDAVYSTKMSVEDVLSEYFSTEKKNVIEKILQGIQDPSTMNKKLIQTKASLSNAGVVTLRVAYEPNHATTKRISAFIERAAGRKVLLDIQVDESLVGGAVVEFQGKFGDFSLNKITSTSGVEVQTDL